MNPIISLFLNHNEKDLKTHFTDDDRSAILDNSEVLSRAICTHSIQFKILETGLGRGMGKETFCSMM